MQEIQSYTAAEFKAKCLEILDRLSPSEARSSPF
jgi:hypothetical protein